MKRFIFLTVFASLFNLVNAQKTIHIYVALCDNVNQGIVTVPSKLGNGQDPAKNLYWGAMYGVKSFFKYKVDEWILVKNVKPENPKILERVLFKHKTQEVYFLADAYDGAQIKSCTIDFLKATNGQGLETIEYENKVLDFAGKSDLVVYCGHNGLMDFELNIEFEELPKKNDCMILACYSKSYFEEYIRRTGANPVLWTTHLMAPEAYTLNAAFETWLKSGNGLQIEEQAAQAYNKFQKCGINGARNLFTTGF
ncbi:MAG: hypothetical protein JXQ87_04750 [Bacteroidia bacterium]